MWGGTSLNSGSESGGGTNISLPSTPKGGGGGTCPPPLIGGGSAGARGALAPPIILFIWFLYIFMSYYS